VSGGRLSGRGKGVAKQADVATGGPLFTICRKRGVGTWWRRNPSGTVSVTWRSVPGGCRRGARLVLTVVPVGPGRCWLFLFGAKERRVDGKRDGRGSLTAGRNGPGRREKVGRQWEGTGQEEKEKAGWPGFARNGKERARKKREKAGWPGFPRNGKERARKKMRKRDGRGSLAMGRNGPGRNGRKRDGRGSRLMGRSGPGRKGESGMAGVPSQGTGQGGRERDVSKVGSGSGVGGWFGSGTGSGMKIGIGMSSAGLRRPFVASAAPWWDCARPATCGWGGGGARLSAESGYCRPEETRVPGRIRWTRLRQLAPR
jgi:hypothetical protein